LIKNNKNQSLNDSFYWEIPGDVPGRRSKPEPSTTTNSTSDHDEQHATALSTDKQQSDHFADAPELLKDPESQLPTSQAQAMPPPRPHSRPRLLNFLPVFISLLVLLVFLGTDDLGFYSDQNKNVAIAAVHTPFADKPIAISNNTVAPQPTIIELIPDNAHNYAQGQLRVITHVVVKGDTLWDIAQTYLKDPFRYPELASLSKIKNPDLIYPNEIVRIHVYESSLALLER